MNALAEAGQALWTNDFEKFNDWSGKRYDRDCKTC